MTPKYKKPKIMLVDMSNECESALRDAGYNVSVGTFGTPYSVPRSDRLFHVTLESCKLPNFEEQEIIVVNTACPNTTESLPEESPGEGVSAIWQSAETGVIDPRPLAMVRVQDAFNRILEHGGIAIVLADRPYEIEYITGSAREYRAFREDNHFKVSNCSFLDQLTKLRWLKNDGNEITFLPEAQDFGKLLKRGAKGARYSSTIKCGHYEEKRWLVLARSKFRDDVAGLLMKEDPPTCLLVLPQMPELHTILPDLMGNWCFQWRPQLFPFHQRGDWLHTNRYELPQITQLRQDISRIEREADAQVNRLQTQIQEIRCDNKDWYTLLNGTGNDLVNAVIRSLTKLGFTKVIDVDEKSRSEGEARTLREDIRIHDQLPILIVDVKGVTGCPEDADATQSEKHALMRSKEFSGDVKPLTIINHERNIPPHDRNPNPYREEIIGNSLQTGLGLMTTWDVFRLLRNKEALSWPDNAVKQVFYRTGRIEPIPDHYIEVGRIVRVWQNAFGINPKKAISVGSRLAIEVGDLFIEIDVESLQVDNDSVDEAPADSDCGVAYMSADGPVKKGMRVFLVERC